MLEISNQKKIVLIQVWLGPIPEYFKFHFETIKNLDYIDFLFFTDQEVEEESENFKKIKIDKVELENLIKSKTQKDVTILNNKKICDLKASYGHLFEDYLDNYDYFGVYDIDTLFGDIRKFISEHVTKYDIISFGSEIVFNRTSGPFLLMKNTEEIKKSYLCDEFFNMMKIPEVTCFEEHYFFENIVKNNLNYKIIYNSCNFIEDEGFYLNYYSEWNNGVLSMNGNEIMLFHFYHKDMLNLTKKNNKILSNYKKKYSEDFYWVTYFSENYEGLAENLLNSLRKHSNRKLIAYTINYEVSNKFLEKWGDDQFIFIRFDIEEGVKDERNRDFNILSLKPKICLESLKKNTISKFVYIDTDVYVTTNVDTVTKYMSELTNYPLFNSHIHDTICISNKKTNWQWINSIELLLRKLEITQDPVYPRRKCNFFIYDEKSKWFFEEQVEIFYELKRTDSLDIVFIFDEDIANCIITKYQLKDALPLIDIEENHELNIQNIENYSYSLSNISEFVKKPQTTNDFLIFHGFKSLDDYAKIKKNYGTTVLSVQDFLSSYKNGTILFVRNNFLHNKQIEPSVNFNIYDKNNDLIFSLRDQELFNYWTFYISDLFLNESEYNIEIEECISKKIIYRNLIGI